MTKLEARGMLNTVLFDGHALTVWRGQKRVNTIPVDQVVRLELKRPRRLVSNGSLDIYFPGGLASTVVFTRRQLPAFEALAAVVQWNQPAPRHVGPSPVAVAGPGDPWPADSLPTGPQQVFVQVPVGPDPAETAAVVRAATWSSRLSLWVMLLVVVPAGAMVLFCLAGAIYVAVK